jgi:6-phosphogluconate dehydrogenase
MQIGLIGLGKMGYPLALNMQESHDVVVYDINEKLRDQIALEGVATTASLAELASTLQAPRVIWIMVTAGKIVDDIIEELIPLLEPGDILIDGGNSMYKKSMERAEKLESYKIGFLDCGTSGGVAGARHGICAMIGGKPEAFAQCEPLFKSVSLPGGYLYCGNSGSGHFVKMVHNGIEYGMMQSIAEGFTLMHKSGFGIDLQQTAALWQQGSVVRSWLVELTGRVFAKDPDLSAIKGIAHTSGEAQWMVETAKEMQVDIPVIDLSLQLRYESLKKESFPMKIIAALRYEFGGHNIEKAEN